MRKGLVPVAAFLGYSVHLKLQKHRTHYPEVDIVGSGGITFRERSVPEGLLEIS